MAEPIEVASGQSPRPASVWHAEKGGAIDFDQQKVWRLFIVMGFRAVSALGGMLFAFLVGKHAGIGALGAVSVVISVAGISHIIAKAGVDIALMREISRKLAVGSHEVDIGRRGFAEGLRRLARPSLVTSICAAGLVAAGVFPGLGLEAALATLLLVPCLVIGRLLGAVLQGRGQAGPAALFELGAITGVAALVFWGLHHLFGRMLPTLGLVIAGVCVAGVAFAWLARGRLQSFHGPAEIDFGGSWHFVVSGLSAFVLQAGSFAIVAPFLELETVGEIRILERLGLLVVFPMVAVNAMVAPMAAKLGANPDQARLRRLLRFSIRLSGLVAIPTAAALWITSGTLIGVFGAEVDVMLVTGLRAVVLASLVQALLGPASIIASMIGLERQHARVSLVFLALGVPAYAVAAATLGREGFIAVYCTILVLQGIRFIALLWSPLGLSPILHWRQSRR